MRFDREFDQSEKAGFAQDGILLSREPFSPQQIVELLDVLEEQEGLLTSPQPYVSSLLRTAFLDKGQCDRLSSFSVGHRSRNWF